MLRFTAHRLLALCLVVALAFLLLLSRAVHREMDHDEHLFVASAALLADHGLLPYRDYPYVHMPNLVFVNAGIFRLTDHRFLAARVLSVACAAVTVGLLFTAATGTLGAWSSARRLTVGAAAVVLLVANPLFIYTSGRAWNHDLPTLLTMLAVLVHLAALGAPARVRILFAASGFLIGAAAGTRLTYLLAVPAFALTVLFVRGGRTIRERAVLLSWHGLGLALGLLPALVLLVASPDRFVFGNLGYPAVSTRLLRAMTFRDKLGYLNGLVAESGQLALAIALVLVVPWKAALTSRLDDAPALRVRFTLLVALCLLAGAFAVTPSQRQYFYAPVPFVILAVVYGLAYRLGRDDEPRLHARVLLVTAFVAVAYGYPSYQGHPLLPVDGWFPWRLHQVGLEIARRVGRGPVLTLAPIWAIEGGADIYPEFATGPFAWRTGHLLQPSRRQRLGIVSPVELPELLRDRPPAAILVGFEGRLEVPFLEYVRERGYRPIELPGGDGGVLWLEPTRQ